MIFINNLSKTYGSRTLFKNLSLTIDRQEKIGLVGPNGAGKSTLFHLILKKLEPSAGSIRINKGVRIGYLPQEASFSSQATVLSELMEGDDSVARLKSEKERLEQENKAGSNRYGKVLEDLEFLGYFNLEHKAKKILAGLGFKPEELMRPVNHLSGGFKMRVLLAKLLTFPYDILLLDEPTNFLDLEAALWFKDYLHGFKGTFIVIAHDRDFLTEVTNYTLILENGAISKVKGNYDDYEQRRLKERQHLWKQFREQEKKIKQLQEFISRFHAQPNKASQVRAKKRALERMELIVVPEDRRESIRKFNFPPARGSGYRVMELKGISKSYEKIQVYKDFDLEITKGERAVFVGPNGAGKSTLLKILAGVIDIDQGQRVTGHNTDIGYFSQTRLDVLNLHHTVFEEAYSVSGGRLSGEEIRTVLAAFLFTGDDVDKKVSILSGGEKSRLILAKLLINPPNFLLLDEPTTHLDVDAVEALIQALTKYAGTLAFISHDIHFVRSVANTVFEIKQGQVRKFPGNFDYYWQRAKEFAFSEKDREKIKSPATAKDTIKPKEKKKGQLEREEKKRIKTHNAQTANKIRNLRQEKEALLLDRNVKARILSNPRSYHNKEMIVEYGRRLKVIEKRLAEIDQEIKKFKSSFL